jgi:hypothetical protein
VEKKIQRRFSVHVGSGVFRDLETLFFNDGCLNQAKYNHFGDRWPARSPHLNPLHFCLLGYIRENVYLTPSGTREIVG